MEYWVYMLIFVFSILVVGRNLYLFINKLFSATPSTYVLDRYELLLLGISISYITTYLIY